MPRVLVTGGAGFVGSHLVEALLARGYAVRVLDDFSAGKRENLAGLAGDLEVREGDVRDGSTVREAVRGSSIVWHLAAIVSVPLSVEDPLRVDAVNAGGTLHLLEAVRREAPAARVVLASSCAVYGDPVRLPCDEDHPMAPLSPYGASKLAAEGYARAYANSLGLSAVVLRYFNVFGPRQDASSPYAGVVALFCEALLRGDTPTIYGTGDQTRDFVDVADVVDANLLAGERNVPAGTTCNVARGESVRVIDLLDRIAEACGRPATPRFAPTRAGDIVHSQAAVDRARDRLGFAARRDLVDGIRKTVDWYRSR